MPQIFNFNGVAKRQEYWAVVVISLLTTTAGTLMVNSGTAMAFAALIILAATLWALLATSARRCRDAAISPFWTVLLFIPYVSLVVTVVIGMLGTKTIEEDVL